MAHDSTIHIMDERKEESSVQDEIAKLEQERNQLTQRLKKMMKDDPERPQNEKRRRQIKDKIYRLRLMLDDDRRQRDQEQARARYARFAQQRRDTQNNQIAPVNKNQNQGGSGSNGQVVVSHPTHGVGNFCSRIMFMLSQLSCSSHSIYRAHFSLLSSSLLVDAQNFNENSGSNAIVEMLQRANLPISVNIGPQFNFSGNATYNASTQNTQHNNSGGNAGAAGTAGVQGMTLEDLDRRAQERHNSMVQEVRSTAPRRQMDPQEKHKSRAQANDCTDIPGMVDLRGNIFSSPEASATAPEVETVDSSPDSAAYFDTIEQEDSKPHATQVLDDGLTPTNSKQTVESDKETQNHDANSQAKKSDTSEKAVLVDGAAPTDEKKSDEPNKDVAKHNEASPTLTVAGPRNRKSFLRQTLDILLAREQSPIAAAEVEADVESSSPDAKGNNAFEMKALGSPVSLINKKDSVHYMSDGILITEVEGILDVADLDDSESNMIMVFVISDKEGEVIEFPVLIKQFSTPDIELFGQQSQVWLDTSNGRKLFRSPTPIKLNELLARISAKEQDAAKKKQITVFKKIDKFHKVGKGVIEGPTLCTGQAMSFKMSLEAGTSCVVKLWYAHDVKLKEIDGGSWKLTGEGVIEDENGNPIHEGPIGLRQCLEAFGVVKLDAVAQDFCRLKNIAMQTFKKVPFSVIDPPDLANEPAESTTESTESDELGKEPEEDDTAGPTVAPEDTNTVGPAVASKNTDAAGHTLTPAAGTVIVSSSGGMYVTLPPLFTTDALENGQAKAKTKTKAAVGKCVKKRHDHAEKGPTAGARGHGKTKADKNSNAPSGEGLKKHHKQAEKGATAALSSSTEHKDVQESRNLVRVKTTYHLAEYRGAVGEIVDEGPKGIFHICFENEELDNKKMKASSFDKASHL